MNCVSCGNPNIKFEFISDSYSTKERNYLCQKLSCYFEFLEIYKCLNQNSPDLMSSIGDTLKFLTPITPNKFVKNFDGFEIFSEELCETNPNVYFNNDRIIEFYLRYLNSCSDQKEGIIIGPLTINQILTKPSDFSSEIKKINKNIFDIVKILIIFRDSTYELQAIMINKEENIDSVKGKNEMIEKDAVCSSLIELLIFQNLIKNDLSNLVSDLIQPKELKNMNKGLFLCQKGEELLKVDKLDQKDKGIIKTDKEMMMKINELINLV